MASDGTAAAQIPKINLLHVSSDDQELEHNNVDEDSANISDSDDNSHSEEAEDSDPRESPDLDRNAELPSSEDDQSSNLSSNLSLEDISSTESSATFSSISDVLRTSSDESSFQGSSSDDDAPDNEKSRDPETASVEISKEKLQWRDTLLDKEEAIATWKKLVLADETCLKDETFQPVLCPRCRAVKWSALAELPMPFSKFPIFEIDDAYEELSCSGCPLCRVFARYITQMDHLPAKVSAINPRLRYKRDKSAMEDVPVLVLRPEGQAPTWFRIIESETDKQNPSISVVQAERIDFDALKEWLSICMGRVGMHEYCRRASYTRPKNLNVIDCKSGRIIPAPEDCRYVALSYVWGVVPTGPESVDHEYPITVRDSIAVTLTLGFEYLWVDRYCIDQKDTAAKHTQIAQMDTIYGRAQLTIIAAAGQDADFGLPGVSTRPRQARPRYSIGPVQLLETDNLGSSFAAVKSSVWATRGWTWQEGLLSTRRLIFTEYHVSFLCDNMACNESHRFQITSRDRMGRYFFQTAPEVGFLMNHHVRSKDVWSYLCAYSRRRLTYEEDVLNACNGFFNFLSLRHFWGLPAKSKDRFPLHWRHDKNGDRISRRKGFPSWSWVGWEGGLCPMFKGVTKNQNELCVDIRVRSALMQRYPRPRNASETPEWFEPIEGQLKESRLHGASAFRKGNPQDICVKAPQLHPILSSVNRSGDNGSQELHATFPSADGQSYEECEVFLDDVSALQNLDKLVTLAVHLGRYEEESGIQGRKLMALFFIPVDGLYERVGDRFKRVAIIFERVGILALDLRADELPKWLKEAGEIKVVIR